MRKLLDEEQLAGGVPGGEATGREVLRVMEIQEGFRVDHRDGHS